MIHTFQHTFKQVSGKFFLFICYSPLILMNHIDCVEVMTMINNQLVLAVMFSGSLFRPKLKPGKG